MSKRDLTKELTAYRAAAGRVDTIDVPPARYLMIDGHGDPSPHGPWADALAALYPVAYTLKFVSKRLGRDHVVMPLEGLWWADDMRSFTTARDKARWSWTAMVMTPDWITATMVDDALATVAAKPQPPAALDQVRHELLEEGRCVQTLHLGPYDAEGPVIEQMHRVHVLDAGLRLAGRHHEIYLSDARRVAPERLRTILRQPVAAVPA